MTILEICEKFRIKGKYVACRNVGTGNINTTYCVSFDRDGEEKMYAIQKINKYVFKRPERVMDNIVRVTDYIRNNIESNGGVSKNMVLKALITEKGLPYVIDEEGEYWRCYKFIKNSITFDSSDDLKIIERAGDAFGKFQRYLSGFDAKSLFISIPDFHNTIKRFNDFHDAVYYDPFNRVKAVQKDIDYLLAFESDATRLQKYLDKGDVPTRVTHNDTKCNNVSFDKDTGEALAVLDLDTVMPGAVAHDYGDAIRFIANTAEEDEADVSKVALDLDKYEAFTKGFIGEVSHTLTPEEKHSMNLGVFTLTVELAVRFLTDYILGDKYFKTLYPGHNLDRAHNQTALAKDMLKHRGQMDAILNKYL